MIDPVISYATYMGGTGLGAVTGVAIDSAGDLYAAGWTEALNFPIVWPRKPPRGGGVDAFIVKLNPTGTALLYRHLHRRVGRRSRRGHRGEHERSSLCHRIDRFHQLPFSAAAATYVGRIENRLCPEIERDWQPVAL